MTLERVLHCMAYFVSQCQTPLTAAHQVYNFIRHGDKKHREGEEYTKSGRKYESVSC